jgi:hypothetical protein
MAYYDDTYETIADNYGLIISGRILKRLKETTRGPKDGDMSQIPRKLTNWRFGKTMIKPPNEDLIDSAGADNTWEVSEISSSMIQDDFDTAMTGITFIADECGNQNNKAYDSDCLDFIKVLRRDRPDIEVITEEANVHVRHSSDIWLPLALLAQDVSLQAFLGLVVNYVYDRIKGALIGEKSSIECSAIFRDGKHETIKKFKFSGTPGELETVLDKLKENEFFDD